MRPDGGALRGVVFDLDDTLADSTGADLLVWETIADLIVERHPAIDRQLLRARYEDALERHYRRFAEGEIEFEQFRWDRLSEALEPWTPLDRGLFSDYLVAKAQVIEEIRPAQGAIEVLRDLRARGIRLGILTNGPGWMQRRKLELCGFEPEVDTVAISGEIGTAKPEPAAFFHVLSELGCGPAAAAMVGDSFANDVLGGLGAGVAHAVWMHGRADDLPPRVTVALSLAEVPGLLGLEG